MGVGDAPIEGSLDMYLASGKLKHARCFWLEGAKLCWDTKRKETGKANKSEPLVAIEDAPATKTAKEWFQTIDADNSGYLDAAELAELYKKARGEKLKGKALQNAMTQMDTDGGGTIELDEFEAWWSANGGDLEKYRHLAFTVTAGGVQLLLVAPDTDTKHRWVFGLKTALRSARRLPPEPEPEPEPEPKTQHKSASQKQLTLTQCRAMVRIQLEIEQLDADVSDAWIDALFNEFDEDGGGTIDDAEWDKLVATLKVRAQERQQKLAAGTPVPEPDVAVRPTSQKQLTLTQCRAMVRIQLEIEQLDADVSEAWIDALFNEFDEDGGGTIDDAEWDKLVATLKVRAQERKQAMVVPDGMQALPEARSVPLLCDSERSDPRCPLSPIENDSKALAAAKAKAAGGKAVAERAAAVAANANVLAEEGMKKAAAAKVLAAERAKAETVAIVNAPVCGLPARKPRIGIIGSTRGTNTLHIYEEINAGRFNAEVAVVISNISKAMILERAREADVPAVHVLGKGRTREEFDTEVNSVLKAHNVDIVLLVGFMRICSPVFCNEWKGKAVNVHPSLLPKHAALMDLEVHQSVLDAGDEESGCTVHMVDAVVDAGRYVVQPSVGVASDETAESLKAKVQALEAPALVEAVNIFANNGYTFAKAPAEDVATMVGTELLALTALQTRQGFNETDADGADSSSSSSYWDEDPGFVKGGEHDGDEFLAAYEDASGRSQQATVVSDESNEQDMTELLSVHASHCQAAMAGEAADLTQHLQQHASELARALGDRLPVNCGTPGLATHAEHTTHKAQDEDMAHKAAKIQMEAEAENARGMLPLQSEVGGAPAMPPVLLPTGSPGITRKDTPATNALHKSPRKLDNETCESEAPKKVPLQALLSSPGPPLMERPIAAGGDAAFAPPVVPLLNLGDELETANGGQALAAAKAKAAGGKAVAETAAAVAANANVLAEEGMKKAAAAKVLAAERAKAEADAADAKAALTADQAEAFAAQAKAAEADAPAAAATAVAGGKQLGKAQVRLIARIQLQIEDVDLSNVTDEWIDGLLQRFDADNSGTIDDTEWDTLVLVLKEEASKIGTEDAAAQVSPTAQQRQHASAREKNGSEPIENHSKDLAAAKAKAAAGKAVAERAAAVAANANVLAAEKAKAAPAQISPSAQQHRHASARSKKGSEPIKTAIQPEPEPEPEPTLAVADSPRHRRHAAGRKKRQSPRVKTPEAGPTGHDSEDDDDFDSADEDGAESDDDFDDVQETAPESPLRVRSTLPAPPPIPERSSPTASPVSTVDAPVDKVSRTQSPPTKASPLGRERMKLTPPPIPDRSNPKPPSTPLSSPNRMIMTPSTGGSSFDTVLSGSPVHTMSLDSDTSLETTMDEDAGSEKPLPLPKRVRSPGVDAVSPESWSAIDPSEAEGLDRMVEPGNDSGPWWSHRRVLVEDANIVGTAERMSMGSWMGGTYTVCALHRFCVPTCADILMCVDRLF